MPVPKHAKKVFHGIIFNVYQWPQKMYDGSIKTFERVIRKDTVAVLATVGKKIILLKQQQPGSKWYYDLVGGRVDNKKFTAKEYASRELMEETGMKAEKLTLYKKFLIRGHVEYDISLYVAKNCTLMGNQQLDGGEKIKITFCTLEDLLKMTDSPNFFVNRAIIDHFLKIRLTPKLKLRLKQALWG